MKIILKLIPLLLVCLFAVGCGKKVESIPPVESVTVTTSEITTTLVTTAVSATATTAPPAATTTVTVPPVAATTPPPTTTKAAVTKYTGSTETESTLATVETPPDPAYEKVNLSTDKATYTLDDEVILTLSNSSEKELLRYGHLWLAIFIDGEWVSASSLNLLEQQTTEFAKPSREMDAISVTSNSPDVTRYNLRSKYGELPAGRYRFGCPVAFGGDTRSVYVEFEIVE